MVHHTTKVLTTERILSYDGLSGQSRQSHRELRVSITALALSVYTSFYGVLEVSRALDVGSVLGVTVHGLCAVTRAKASLLLGRIVRSHGRLYRLLPMLSTLPTSFPGFPGTRYSNCLSML